jgi:hypothetical protein
MLREKFEQVKKSKGKSTKAENRDGAVCSSDEVTVMEMERRDSIIQSICKITRNKRWKTRKGRKS